MDDRTVGSYGTALERWPVENAIINLIQVALEVGAGGGGGGGGC